MDMNGQAVAMPAAIGAPDDDPAARLGTLFDTHHQRLFRLARRLSRHPEDAHDIVQETFLRAARSPRSIPNGHSSEEAWLVRVLINICRDLGWVQETNGLYRLTPLGEKDRAQTLAALA